MRVSSQLLALSGTAAIVFMMPIGQTTQVMTLLVGLNLILISMIGRDVLARRRVAIQIEQQQRQLYLLRRTVPHLRARRPIGVVEAQVRWRQASEAHRRRNQA